MFDGLIYWDMQVNLILQENVWFIAFIQGSLLVENIVCVNLRQKLGRFAEALNLLNFPM